MGGVSGEAGSGLDSSRGWFRRVPPSPPLKSPKVFKVDTLGLDFGPTTDKGRRFGAGPKLNSCWFRAVSLSSFGILKAAVR